MRQRLSWDQEKIAEIAKNADPYTMNQDRKNPPVEKYDIGGPSQFAEDPDKKTPWKTEGRDETGHPAPAREAVKAARRMEDKALKCITIAQRMLPGASDGMIENQATEFMYLPEDAVLATLQRQASWGESLVPADKEAAKKGENQDEEADKDQDKEAAKKGEEKEDVKPEDAEKEASKKGEEKEDVKPEDVEKEAAKKGEEKEDDAKPEDAEKEAAKKGDGKEEDVKPEDAEKEAAKKGEDKKEDEGADKEASVDLLDSIFASEEKTGAKKLSGIVKQASDSDNSLESLWSAPPDVSKAFQ